MHTYNDITCCRYLSKLADIVAPQSPTLLPGAHLAGGRFVLHLSFYSELSARAVNRPLLWLPYIIQDCYHSLLPSTLLLL